MRITFVLPAPVRIPMGGAAVVYRHAEGLVARGHEVTVVAPRSGAGGGMGRLRALAVHVRDRLHGVASVPYYEAQGVETLEVDAIRQECLPLSDAVIATGYQTAPWVADNLGTSRGVYFLQYDERNLNPRAGETWRLPLARVAISHWVADTVSAAGFPVRGVVPNAVDPADFRVDSPIEGRAPRVVALYHRHPVKGPETLVNALHEIRRRFPSAEADVISARPPSHRLPAWARLHIRPDTGDFRGICNRAAVVLHTSRLEGWGLVPMEAAACGCAVVATASRGVAEYLRDGVSMIQVPVGDASAVADAAVRLLTDMALRTSFASAAVADVARFSWDASTDEFERLLVEIVS